MKKNENIFYLIFYNVCINFIVKDLRYFFVCEGFIYLGCNPILWYYTIIFSIYLAIFL